MGIENLGYPFIGFVTCKNRERCSLHLGDRGPCFLAARHEGRGAPVEARSAIQMGYKLWSLERLAPCKVGTKCELIDKDGDVVRGQNVTLEWEKFPSITRITQEELF